MRHVQPRDVTGDMSGPDHDWECEQDDFLLQPKRPQREQDEESQRWERERLLCIIL